MIRISLCVAAVILLGPGLGLAQPDPNVPLPAEPAVRSTLGIRAGIYSAEKLEETTLDQSLARRRTASNLYLTFNFTRHLTRALALEASIGGLSRGETLIRDPDGITIRRAQVSIYPLSIGMRFYPLAPDARRRIIGYLSGAGSLVLGVQVFNTSGSQYTYSFDYSSETDLTFGAVVGAGMDYRLGSRYLLGLFGGYQFADFSKPLSDLPGGVSDFSGPQFMITFSYLISGPPHGPRGEGKYGN